MPTLSKTLPTGFYFRESDHRYFFDGKPMTGITTITGSVKQVPLSWAANTSVDFIKTNAGKVSNLVIEKDGVPQRELVAAITETLDELIIVRPEVLEEARTAHEKIRDTAAEKGTDVHAVIEGIVKGAMERDGYLTIADLESNAHNRQIQQFVAWALLKRVKFLASEKVIYDTDLFIAGTADFVVEMNGQKFIGDLKTGKGIYYEAFMQTAAYRMMLEKQGEKDFVGTIIVHVPASGELKTHERFDYETDRKAFEGALTIYRARQTWQK